MNNFILFVNSFLSYLLVYFVFAALIIIAVLVGIKVRKAKNDKEAVAGVEMVDDTPNQATE